MKEHVLWIDTTQFIVRTYPFKPADLGAAMLVAMHIAIHGPLPVRQVRKVARIRGRQKWLSDWLEQRVFYIEDDCLHLDPTVFRPATRGSDERRNLPASLRELIHERDGYLCTYCGTGEGPFHVDHIIPVSKGGSDDPDNLCLACPSCNCSKSDKLLSEWRPAK